MYFHFLENGGLNVILINDKVSLGQVSYSYQKQLKKFNCIKSAYKWWKTSDYILSLCNLSTCLHPTEIVVYILYRKSRDKLSSRIAVLFADLPITNRNCCLHRLFCWSHMSHCFHTLNQRNENSALWCTLNLPHPLTLLISPHFITYFGDHTWTIAFSDDYIKYWILHLNREINQPNAMFHQTIKTICQ